MVYVYGEEQPEISTNTGLHLYLGLLCEPSWTGFSASLIFFPCKFYSSVTQTLTCLLPRASKMIPDLRTDNHLSIVETAVRREYIWRSRTRLRLLTGEDLVPVTVHTFTCA
jgi:hypothetical protein